MGACFSKTINQDYFIVALYRVTSQMPKTYNGKNLVRNLKIAFFKLSHPAVHMKQFDEFPESGHLPSRVKLILT